MVWRKDSSRPFTSQVSYGEYVQKTSDGQPTKFWAEKPETMLKKVAESQALRKAFNICGVYSPEELGAGYETDGGDILPPAIDVQATRNEPSHLSVVPPPASIPAPAFTEEDDLPVISLPEVPPASPLTEEGIVDEVIGLLEGKQIPYEIDMETGFISARSFNHKELLKATGFKWSPDTKSWIFRLEPTPF